MPTLPRSAVALAATFALTANAGLKIVMEVKQSKGTSTMAMWFEGKNARMEITKPGATAPSHAIIRDADHQTMLMVDFEKKTFHEVSDEQSKRMRERMKAQTSVAMAKMKEQMAAMPPEQRAKMEAMMGGMPSEPAEEKLVKGSGSKKIAGYTCELYTVMANGAQVAEACLIPWASLKLDKEQVRKSLQALREGMGVGMPGTEKHWEDESGMLAWRRAMKDGEARESTMVSYAQEPVPASTFAAPAGLTKKAIPGLE